MKNISPDIVANGSVPYAKRLQKAGMNDVEQMVRFEKADGFGEAPLPALVDLHVNVNKENAKGIHMSRLYLMTQEVLGSNPLNFKTLEKAADQMISSHSDQADTAYICVRTELPLMRNALKSEYRGWRHYPVCFELKKTHENLECTLKLDILYSSTCPCSAALSRELIQANFKSSFAEGNVSVEDVHEWLGKSTSINATPHGQRSKARLELKIDVSSNLSILSLIDQVESALGTPVQAAVKREDEQNFAHLNASNLMFVEDAARVLAKSLDQHDLIKDYKVEVTHYESLHAHNAQAVVCKY